MEGQMNYMKNQMNDIQISHKNQKNYMQIRIKIKLILCRQNHLFQMDKIIKSKEKKYQMKIIDLQNDLQKLGNEQIEQESEINRINNKIEELTNS